MLEVLHIENIAIIEEADIRFEPGFNALTGETGAGKSIVIDALGAVLGQRASRELIRTGMDKAFVSAVFSGVDNSVPEALGITQEEDGSLLLQREIHGDGKNVCRVNGRPVTVGQLKMLGSRLLNIHGQHDGQQLLDEEQHLLLLDSFGKLETLINAYAEKYKDFTDIQKKIQSLEMDESEKARRVDTLSYQIGELERAQLRAGEEEELSARRNLLRNAEKFISAVSEADYAMNGDDGGDGALGLLRRAQDAVGAVRHLDEDYAKLYERIEALYSEAYDVAATIEDKREGFDFSPHELDDVESRMDQLYRLKKKYGPSVEDMLAMNLVDLRLILEPGIAELAAYNATDEEIVHLKDLCDTVEYKIDHNLYYIQDDIDFHTYIARCSKNKVVEQIISIIETAVLMFVNLTHRRLRQETIITHRAITKSIAEHDPVGARSAMTMHISYNRAAIKEIYDARNRELENQEQ